MISSTPPAEPHSPDRADRWRLSWLVILALTLVVLIAVVVGNQVTADSAPVAASSPSASLDPASGSGALPGAASSAGAGVVPPVAASPGVSRSPLSGDPGAPILESASASPSSAKPFPAAGLLRLSGKVPTHGSGQFVYGSKRSPVLGHKGQLRRFRVAVEKGSNEDADTFAAQVQSILGDKRSWIGNGNLRLQMVSGTDKADFTVYLATRDTAGQMCARGGTNIRVGGVPYTSCRTPGKAIINLDRWRLSATPYVNAKVELATYRRYVINHEVGHELGHGHQGCPKKGGPAPVMVQQTLTLRGCVPYAWPRRDNRSFSGPAI
ncbi:hypothetical protein AMIS_5410 [Actinoplanes missouriensis 431]|uniref:DUF3152 domain-containing protein n=1 Tax=Actinoplanes missouriensis (strain ATCC 14538 / DSM 43046 / CBS 188.64 / JCM 3121 / NBRC 102363 / NCIMB 12654 / NRRL B-3342 / UNCC 431) TaxID=512565 RepID=I0GYC4_ACTM4|nr:DUF3152 domain-containing protein [Actinoplanes missouriensis]BAL85761.1 hypothetical protein AMIS_5410 [Actinoplanes missouriensis 431]